MQAEPLPAAEAALTRRFLQDFPHEAARLLEAMAAPEAANTLALKDHVFFVVILGLYRWSR